MDSNQTAVPLAKRFHFEFLLPFLLHPAGTFAQVTQKRATWLTPLLLVSLLIVLRVLLAPPVPAIPGSDVLPDPSRPIIVGPKGMESENTQGVQLVSANLQGGGGGGGGEGDGGKFPVDGEGEMPVDSGPGLMGTLVSALGAVAGLWAGWFLLSVLLYFGMVVSGGNHSFTQMLNLTAWASLPFGVRQIVMTIATLAVPALAGNPSGLAALVSSMGGPAGMFLSSLFRLVDVYLIWHVILLVIGLRQGSPLAARRIVGVTLGAVGLFLVLACMPGFLAGIFTQLTTPVPVTY